MKLPKRIYRFLSLLLSFNLIFQSVAPGLIYAVEELSAPETETIQPTAEPTTEPAAPVSEPTDTPTPTSTPDTPAPTLEASPTPTIEITPNLEVSPTPTPTPELPQELQTITIEAPTPVPTPLPLWTELDGNTITTSQNVGEGVEYRYKNSGLIIKFTRITSPGKLTIKEVILSPEQVSATGALSNVAYDVTSEMENGSFEYDLTLPIPNNTPEVEVKYASSTDNLSQSQVVPEATEVSPNTVTITGLDHFTVFFVTDANDKANDGAFCNLLGGECTFNATELESLKYDDDVKFDIASYLPNPDEQGFWPNLGYSTERFVRFSFDPQIPNGTSITNAALKFVYQTNLIDSNDPYGVKIELKNGNNWVEIANTTSAIGPDLTTQDQSYIVTLPNSFQNVNKLNDLRVRFSMFGDSADELPAVTTSFDQVVLLLDEDITELSIDSSISAPSQPIVWPGTWTTPSQCSTDPANDENPSQIDLVGDSGNPAVGFASDANYLYLRERVGGNPINHAGGYDQNAWVVLFQKTQPEYQYLASVNGKDDKVQIYSNSTPDGAVDFSPLHNDPAETLLWEGNASDYARGISAGGGFYFVDWAIPWTELTPLGITLSTNKFFATSADANNYNKDHLNCYEALVDLAITKSDSPDPLSDGGTLTYTLTITNSGPDTAENVVVTDLLPAQFTQTSIVSSQGSCTLSVCNLGSLANGASATITIVGTVNGVGTITNTATVTTDTFDTNTLNNTDSEDTTVNPATATLTVIKVMDNGNGGNAVPSDFTLTVTGQNPSPSSFPGSSVGTTVTLNVGEYSVSETAGPSGYSVSYSADCSGSITAGQTKTCTVTNDDIAPTITLNKIVDLSNGGDAQSSDFTLKLDGSAVTQGVAQPVSANTAHTITETGSDGYSFVEITGNAKCPAALGGSVTLLPGENITCFITNASQKGTLTIVKNTIGGNATFGFELDGPTSLSTSVATTANSGDVDVPVIAGSYTVTENDLAGWELTDSDCLTEFSIAPGETKTCTFTNTKYGSISGNKYEQGSQTSLAGWLISLFLDDVLIDTQTTTVLGYIFDNLLPGEYSLAETLLGGWTQVSAPSPVVLEAGENSTGNNFINFRNISISGQKYNDLDGDGVKDLDEPGLSGWEIVLLTTSDQEIDSTTTDGGGNYSFADLGPGTYRVREVGQPDWTQTSLNPADITVSSGQNVSGITFGNRGDGTITVHKAIRGTTTDLTQFCFTLSPDPNLGEICADENGDAIFENVPSGNYSVLETSSNPDYSQASSTCSNLTIINGGDSLSCTVTNSRDQGTIEFEKIVDDDSDVSGWTFTIDGIGEFKSGDSVTLDTGTYTVTESGSEDYTPESVGGICSSLDGSSATLSVTKDGGVCTFTNEVNKGSIRVTKITDPSSNEDSEDSFEISLGGDEEDTVYLSDQESYLFENLFPGSYSLTEDVPDGWELSAVCSDNESSRLLDESEIDPSDINLQPGQDISCTFTNTKLGSITIIKDANPDSTKVFTFDGDLGEFNLVDGNSQIGNTKTFSNLSPDTYTITEQETEGWGLEDITCDGEEGINLESRSVQVDLQAGEDVICTFTNDYLSPLLTLTKTNNAFGDKTPGSSVTFTLTVRVTQNGVQNAKVIDLPAKGFKYRLGTWQAKLNGISYDIDEPIYHSPGTWELGDLEEGDVVELTYIADIDTTQTPGQYFDLAWANGEGLGGPVLAQGSDGAFVGTTVNVVKDTQDSPTREVENKQIIQGQVLGATTLPATGSDTSWLYLALTLGFLGVGFTSVGLVNRKKYE